MYNIDKLSLVPGAIKGTSYTMLLRIGNYHGGIMRLREFFPRQNETRSKKIFCSSLAKSLIAEWLEKGGWDFKDFPDILEHAGVKTPVKCEKFEAHSLKCTTADDKEVIILLLSEEWFNLFSGVEIKEGGETRKYNINSNLNPGKTVLQVTLEEKSIKGEDKKLISSYYKSYHVRLVFDGHYELQIGIHNPKKEEKDDTDNLMDKYQKVEDYLMKIDKSSIEITHVYDRVIEILGLSRDDISNSEKIWFSYDEIVGVKSETISEIFLERGEIQRYAVCENGETFHVYKNGSWKYRSSNIRIYFNGQDYVFITKGSETLITETSQADTMSRVKERIFKLQQILE